MKLTHALFAVGIAAFSLTGPAHAVGDGEETPEDTLILTSEDFNLNDVRWTKRPIIVFADSPFDPSFTEQMELIEERRDALLERDVVVLTDTDPDTLSALRKKLRPRGFALVLIGKDGGVKLRKPRPWDVREISRVIDKMPMRQQEIRDASTRDD